LPLEIRVAIDDARFDKERHRPAEPFHTESDLSIAVAATIAASIPLRDLLPVFTAAQKKMGLGQAPSAHPQRVTMGDTPIPPVATQAKAAAVKASTPPPAPAPAPSAPAPASIAPPAARASSPAPAPSRPPPAVSAYAPPPSSGSAGAPKKSEASGNAGTKGAARAQSTTIPDVLHTISGEEERTNPWDIPTEETHPRGGEKG
jgi:hypothetical protein